MCGGNNNDKFLGNWVDINKNRAVASMYNQGITTYKKENGIWKKTIISEIGPQWYNYTFSYQNPRSYYYYGSSSGNVYTGAKHRNLKLTDKAIFWGTSQRDDNKTNSGSLFRIPFTADKNHLQLTFDENIQDNTNVDKLDFNLQYNYVDTDIKDIKIESGLVKIEPKKYFYGNDIKQLKLTYTKNVSSSKNITDAVGNAVESFTHDFDDIKPTHTTTEIVTKNNIGIGNWIEVTSAIGSQKMWYSIASSVDGTKLVAAIYGGYIWRSSDSGITWTQDTSVGGVKNWYNITSSIDGTKLVAVVYGGSIWTSNDSGITWNEDTSIGSTKNWEAVDMSSDGTIVAAVHYGGNIWISNNSGKTWNEDTSVGSNHLWEDVTVSGDGTKMAAVIMNGDIWTSSNSGVISLKIHLLDQRKDGEVLLHQ